MCKFIAKTDEELAQGINDEEDSITIQVPDYNEEKEENPEKSDKDIQDGINAVIKLKKGVVKIKATGKVAWAVAIGGIAAAVIIFLASGGSGILFSPIILSSTVGVLGVPATLTAIGIAVAGGSVATLNKLRKYKIVENSDKRLVLKRK